MSTKKTAEKTETKKAAAPKKEKSIISRVIKGREESVNALVKNGRSPKFNDVIPLTEFDKKELGITANSVKIGLEFTP